MVQSVGAIVVKSAWKVPMIPKQCWHCQIYTQIQMNAIAHRNTKKVTTDQAIVRTTKRDLPLHNGRGGKCMQQKLTNSKYLPPAKSTNGACSSVSRKESDRGEKAGDKSVCNNPESPGEKYRKPKKSARQNVRDGMGQQQTGSNDECESKLLRIMGRLDALSSQYDRIIAEDRQLLGDSQQAATRRLRRMSIRENTILSQYKEQQPGLIYIHLTKRCSNPRSRQTKDDKKPIERAKSSENSIDRSTLGSSSFQKPENIQTPQKNILIRSKSQPHSRVILTYKSRLLINGRQMKQTQ